MGESFEDPTGFPYPKPLPAIRSVIGSEEHLDSSMPRIFEADRALAVIIIEEPHAVVDGEVELNVTAHVSEEAPIEVIAAMLHGVADGLMGARDEP